MQQVHLRCDQRRLGFGRGSEQALSGDVVPPAQLSKEFVRQWLIENGFQGKEGQQVPEMTEAFVSSVSERYIELYENITGESFQKATSDNIESRIEENIKNYLKSL